MKLRGTFVVAMSVMLMLLPVLPAAGSSAAGEMTSRGTVQINGVAAPGMTSVFAGDRIATEKASTTSLSFPSGDAVVIPELSQATLVKSEGRTVVRLESGALSVVNKSKAPIVIEALGARIQANTSGPAIYSVVVRGNSLQVITTSGSAHVEAANHEGNVVPGTALNATFAPAAQAPGGVSGGNALTATGWTWVAVGIGAAAGLGVGIYEATKGSSSSPSTPD